jgi:hypothetical protein
MIVTNFGCLQLHSPGKIILIVLVERKIGFREISNNYNKSL